MSDRPVGPVLELDPALVEEAVFLRLRRAAEERDGLAEEWEREREATFALQDPRERERAFAGLARRWFDRLGFARALEDPLRVAPSVRALGRIRVRRALGRRDEGSDLFDQDGETRFEVTLAPARFLDPAALRELLVLECLYAEDMLDAAFGYRRGLGPGLADDWARTELVRDRLAMLWRARTRARAAARLGEPVPSQTPAGFQRAFAGALDASGIERLHERAACGALATFSQLLAAARGEPVQSEAAGPCSSESMSERHARSIRENRR